MVFMKRNLFLFLALLLFFANGFAQPGNTGVISASRSVRPIVTHQEKAKYTQAALDNGIHGTVVLRMIFRADGKLSDITPIKTLPDGLTDMAIEAAQKIRFKPATKDGNPVSVRMAVEFTFALEYRNKNHQKRVIKHAFPFLTNENIDNLVQAFDKHKPGTDQTDLWLVACEKQGVRKFTKSEKEEFQALQMQAVQYLSEPNQKAVQSIMTLWDEDKIQDSDLYRLATYIFEGIALSPPDKQKRFIELHNQAVSTGLQQFQAK